MPPTSERQMTLHSRLVPFLTGLLLLLQLFDPHQGWMMFLVVLGGAWLLGFFWARSLAAGLHLTREQRFGWAQVGDRLEERWTLRNEGWAPALWVEVLDRSTLPDTGGSIATGLGGEAASHWLTHSLCGRRGLFTIGPTAVVSADPFGIYRVEILYASVTEQVVLPPVLPLPEIQIATGGHSGDGRARPYMLHRATTSSTVRPYLPGDNPRWIHWPTSAHHNELLVREFDGAPEGDWWIVLDTQAVPSEDEGLALEVERAIILAASLAERGLHEGRSIGLVAQGRDLLWLPPSQGERHRLRILRDLALLSPGALPLADLLERVRPALGRYASVIIITTGREEAWVEQMVPLLRQGTTPTVLLLPDPPPASRLDAVQALLSDLGVRSTRIPDETFASPEAQPGEQGAWKWRVLGTGRLIATQQPTEMEWKRLW